MDFYVHVKCTLGFYVHVKCTLGFYHDVRYVTVKPFVANDHLTICVNISFRLKIHKSGGL